MIDVQNVQLYVILMFLNELQRLSAVQKSPGLILRCMSIYQNQKFCYSEYIFNEPGNGKKIMRCEDVSLEENELFLRRMVIQQIYLSDGPEKTSQTNQNQSAHQQSNE